MNEIKNAILACIEERNKPLVNHDVFTAHGVCFHLMSVRHRRSGLPLDAKEFRILLEHPKAQGLDDWNCEVVIAVREQKVFNPACHMRVVDYWADDLAEKQEVEARVLDWAMSI